VLTPWLTDAEIDEACEGLTQDAARARYLRTLGLRVDRRPGGGLTVWRPGMEPGAARPAPAPRATTAPDLPPAWGTTALGRWQAAQRAAKRAEGKAPKPFRLTAKELRAIKLSIAERRAAIVRYHAAKRRAARLQRTPPWADLKAIRAVYALARALTVSTGVEHHVDHEYPLQGKLVSGLHVPANLRVITWRENVRKRNRFEVCG
jgi:hypothetical protein